MFRKIDRPAGSASAPSRGHPFAKGRRVWDEWIGDALRREKIAYGIAFGCLAITGYAVWDAGEARRGNRMIPIVVERDAFGHIVASGPAGRPRQLTEAQISKRLIDWTRDVRSIYVDGDALRTAVLSSYAAVKKGSPAFSRLIDYHQRDKPEDRAARHTTYVYQITALPHSAKTWQVDWRERTTGRDGQVLADEQWRLTASFTVEPPATAEEFAENPDGFLIESFDWHRVDNGARGAPDTPAPTVNFPQSTAGQRMEMPMPAPVTSTSGVPR